MLTTLEKVLATIFAWEHVDSAPDELPLFLLNKGDYQIESSIISCQQAIAGDGAFSLGMIARFNSELANDPHLYRRLYWEAGMIGQLIYLEAEACGLRGTGIGCYLDDMVHELLGIKDDSYQDIYHFTVGKPVEDSRLGSLPAYHHIGA